MSKFLMTVLVVAGMGLGLTPAAQAITVDEVIQLAQAGSQDGVIMSKIDADETVFQLTVEEILGLQDAGVSNTVITYMINTGKQFGNEEADTEAAPDEERYEYGDYEVYDDDVEEDDDGSWAVGLGYSNIGFGVTVGYYYPSWPGYYYSAYYDPFYWTGWGYYYSWFAPYPYWRWYDRFYACYPYSYSYWNRCSTPYPYYGKHHGHGYVHKDYYARYDHEGRHTGSRGSVERGRRVRDGGAAPEAVMANNRIITPREPGVRVVREQPRSPEKRGYTLRRPKVAVKKESPGDGNTPRRIVRETPRVKQPRVKIKRDQPSTEVKQPVQKGNSRKVRKPAVTPKPVKVKPKKDNPQKDEKPKPRRVSPKPAPQVKAQPAPTPAPAKAKPVKRQPKSRRGGGGGRP